MERLDAMRRIRMTVFKPARRPFYSMRWVDPITGRKREETTRCKSRRSALDVAAEKAAEVLSTGPRDLWWDDFCELYESQKESRRTGRAKEPWITTKHWIKRFKPPRMLSEITSSWVSSWQDRLRNPGKLEKRKALSENTVASYSARLRGALRWAKSQGYIDQVPAIAVNVTEAPRSRAITGEEFERILAIVPKVRPADWKQWDRFLRGQWQCGFRISELIRLSWEESAPIHVESGGHFPYVVLAAGSNKKRKQRLRAVTPEFWEVCCETPERCRRGLVFPILRSDGRQLSAKRICKIIGKFGRKAGVITNTETGKTATSHDTRRGFACQMDGRGLTLSELQRWMDHADIRTTLTYYRTVEAEQLAAKIWPATKAGGALGGAGPSADDHATDSENTES
jgi:integrase